SFFFLFLSLLPRLPSSILFPYTTLFRSRLPVRFVGGENRFVLKSMISISTPSPSAAGVIRSLSIVPVRMPSGRRRRKRNSLQRPDRKSTRLNSSHLGISYAVFCLKKKKK